MATVEKPWTRAGSSASSGMCSAAGVVVTRRKVTSAAKPQAGIAV
jgi:hypothetical protein